MKWIRLSDKEPESWTDIHLRHADTKDVLTVLEVYSDSYYREQIEWLDESEPSFTLEQAVEIYTDAFRNGWTSLMTVQEYFKTKFNIDI